MKITSVIMFQFKAFTAPKHYLSGDLCLSFEIFIIYDWYFYITYTCGMDLTDDKYFFPEFSNMLFESGEVKIDSKVYHMFRKFYQCYYDIFQNYRTIEWSFCWNNAQTVLFHFPTLSSYVSNRFPYTSVMILFLRPLTYYHMILLKWFLFNITIMLLLWLHLSQNTHLVVFWKIPSLMNLVSPYNHIFRI